MRILKWLLPVIIVLCAVLWYEVTTVDRQTDDQTPPEPPQETFVRQLDADHAEYRNARFDFNVRFPSRLLIAQGESDNGDGQVFRSADDQTKLITSGINKLDEDSLQNEFEQEFQTPPSKRKIIYKTLKENWYVVSGLEGKTVFYLKRFLVDDHFVRLEITYPVDQRQQWDPVVSQLEQDFQAVQILRSE